MAASLALTSPRLRFSHIDTEDETFDNILAVAGECSTSFSSRDTT